MWPPFLAYAILSRLFFHFPHLLFTSPPQYSSIVGEKNDSSLDVVQQFFDRHFLSFFSPPKPHTISTHCFPVNAFSLSVGIHTVTSYIAHSIIAQALVQIKLEAQFWTSSECGRQFNRNLNGHFVQPPPFFSCFSAHLVNLILDDNHLIISRSKDELVSTQFVFGLASNYENENFWQLYLTNLLAKVFFFRCWMRLLLWDQKIFVKVLQVKSEKTTAGIWWEYSADTKI